MTELDGMTERIRFLRVMYFVYLVLEGWGERGRSNYGFEPVSSIRGITKRGERRVCRGRLVCENATELGQIVTYAEAMLWAACDVLEVKYFGVPTARFALGGATNGRTVVAT